MKPCLLVFLVLLLCATVGVVRGAPDTSPLAISSLTYTSPTFVYYESDTLAGILFSAFETTIYATFTQPSNVSLDVYWSVAGLNYTFTGAEFGMTAYGPPPAGYYPNLSGNITESGKASVNLIFANTTGGARVVCTVVDPLTLANVSTVIFVSAPSAVTVAALPATATNVLVYVGQYLPYVCNISIDGAFPVAVDWASMIGTTETGPNFTDTNYWYFDSLGFVISHVPYFATLPGYGTLATECGLPGMSPTLSENVYGFLFCEVYPVSAFDVSVGADWGNQNCGVFTGWSGATVNIMNQVSLISDPLPPVAGQPFTATVVAQAFPNADPPLLGVNVTFGTLVTIALNLSGNTSAITWGNQTSVLNATLAINATSTPIYTWTFTLQLPASLYNVVMVAWMGGTYPSYFSPDIPFLVDNAFTLGNISGTNEASPLLPVAFSCNISGLSGNSPISVTWDFGDGDTYQDHYAYGMPSVASTGTTTTTAAHMYTSDMPNNTVVTLTVASQWGYKTSASFAIARAASSACVAACPTCPVPTPTPAPTPCPTSAPTPAPTPCPVSNCTVCAPPVVSTAPLNVVFMNVPFWGWFIILLVGQFLLWVIILFVLESFRCCTCHPRTSPSFSLT